MKTDDLIRALAADGAEAPPIGRAFGTRLVPGVILAVCLYSAVLGLRPNLLTALESDPRVFFKIGLMVLLACLIAPLALRLVRPGSKWRGSALSLICVPVLLLAAVGIELSVLPQTDWAPRLIGHNAVLCMISIPLLAVGPLAALLLGMRYGAPTQPALAGAAAGLFAGAIGAALYATHCPDDSPLFVVTWYVLGIAIVTVAGSVIGARLLRW
jgi:hypothetical protein